MQTTQIIEALLAAIASLAGVIGTLVSFQNAQYKRTIAEKDKHIDRLENREDTTLKDISTAIGQDAATTATMAESLKSIVEFVQEERFKDKYGVRAVQP